MIILEKRATTYRARRVLCEPAVDALDVEAVTAPREQAHLLAIHELAEADGALCPRKCTGLASFVLHHRYLSQLDLTEPTTAGAAVTVTVIASVVVAAPMARRAQRTGRVRR
jgi:hypothetical protein